MKVVKTVQLVPTCGLMPQEQRVGGCGVFSKKLLGVFYVMLCYGEYGEGR